MDTSYLVCNMLGSIYVPSTLVFYCRNAQLICMVFDGIFPLLSKLGYGTFCYLEIFGLAFSTKMIQV